MKSKLAYLLSFLGLLTVGWYIGTVLWGWSTDPFLLFLWAAALAAAARLAGAALAWAGRRWTGRIWLVCGLLVLAALVLIPPIFHEHEPNPPQVLISFPMLGFLAPQLLPGLALVAAAILLATGLKQAPLRPGPVGGPAVDPSGGLQRSARAASIVVALCGLVLIGGMYHLHWLFVWDSTYDPIDIIFLVFILLAALFSAAGLAALLPGGPKLAAPLYAILIPAMIVVVMLGAKQEDYRQLTERRAERVSRALEKYHARRGSYPGSLDRLAPWTMLSIPGPVIMYGQDWCYQGGRDWYRLGYVDRENWSSPELFAHESQARGQAPGAEALCAAEIALMKERYPDFYGLETRSQ